MPLPEAGTGLDLARLIRRQLDRLGHADDADVARLVDEVQRRHGGCVAAVLLYGSYLRGKRDTLLDFYVLLTDLPGAMPPLQAWGNRVLPPNVYYLALPGPEQGQALRAKYATMTMNQFQHAMGDFHSYFWARFTQPAGLVRARDEAAARRVADAVARAVTRFATEVAPTLEGRFDAARFWQRGLALTYASELRAEDPAGAAELYRHNARHFDELLAACADRGIAVHRHDDGGYLSVRAGGGLQRLLWPVRWRVQWRLRRVQGKFLSVLRLMKAAATFDDPLDYLLWKIERHSGIHVTPSERQRRHPLVFAWPLLWRLYRRGAFR